MEAVTDVDSALAVISQHVDHYDGVLKGKLKKDKKFAAFLKKIGVLDHKVIPIHGGGRVLLLDTGAKLGPEETAMLQALYSRDPGTVLEHLAKIEEVGAEKFMSQFYVGYGHQSIGDCGHVTLFIEGVSMLTAKAIQDFMLYAGQEVSTRYVDFSKQPFVLSDLLADWPEKFRAFYVSAFPVLVAYLKSLYPMGGDEKEPTWARAINARAFDILRGFLPAGATTSVAWHVNLRKAREHTAQLRNHALAEVRATGDAIEAALLEGHPSSFADNKVKDVVVPKRYLESEAYLARYMRGGYYFVDEKCPEFSLVRNNVSLCSWATKVAMERPRHTELPKALGEYGTMQFQFLLDFASFRDIQRQRAVIQRMPLLTIDHGFHPWYIDQLPEELATQARVLLGEFEQAVHAAVAGLPVDSEEIAALQYGIPMGYRVPQRVTGDLPALVYLVELRTSQTVHATLREQAQKMARAIDREFGIPIYADYEPDRFSVKRGDQTILKK